MCVVGGFNRLEPRAEPVDVGIRRRGSTLMAVCAAVLFGLLGSGALVWQRTASVVSATTSNGPNSWTLGDITLSDDDRGSAVFSASGLVPGSTGTNCIAVTYSGTVPTSVKLYASASSDAASVAQYIDSPIQQGSGGGFGSCSSFTAAATIYSGTLASLAATSTDYASGLGSWTPGSTSAKVYKFTYTLNPSTPSSKQGASTSATFQWETQA